MAIEILVVCSANQCRSPMAEGFLRAELASHAIDAIVRSAGVMALADMPPTEDAIATMARAGVDIGAHRSQAVVSGDVEHADLVLGMTRAHVRELVLDVPSAWPRTYTLKEIVRRAEKQGPRALHENVGEWITRIGALRQPAELVGSDPVDDIDDPIGQPRSVYEAVANELAELTGRLVAAMFPARPSATETA
jgi:protein-tyrosine phosphatase